MKKQERYIATEQLLQAVNELGLRQDWIANQVGLPKSTFSRVVRGLRPVDREIAEQISTVLRVPFFVAFELPIRDGSMQEGSIAA